jgi:SAM-dependent methyltransferase
MAGLPASPTRRSLLAALGTALVAPRHAVAQSGAVELDTPFVTTPDDVVRQMLDLAGLRSGERLLDLGSGDGRIVIEAARRGARAHGVEIDPRLIERSREAASRAGVAERATFAAEDLFTTDFTGHDVVTMYLLPDVNARLAPRLFATLAPGARIVSHDYGLGEWPADVRTEVDAPGKTVGVAKRSTLLRWTVPAKLAGRWQGTAGAERIVLDVAQSWQHVSGTLQRGARAHAFVHQRVEGRTVAIAGLGGRGAPRSLRLVAVADGRLAGELHAPTGAWPVVLLRDGAAAAGAR